jgi:hypothetical protein
MRRLAALLTIVALSGCGGQSPTSPVIPPVPPPLGVMDSLDIWVYDDGRYNNYGVPMDWWVTVGDTVAHLQGSVAGDPRSPSARLAYDTRDSVRIEAVGWAPDSTLHGLVRCTYAYTYPPQDSASRVVTTVDWNRRVPELIEVRQWLAGDPGTTSRSLHVTLTATRNDYQHDWPPRP